MATKWIDRFTETLTFMCGGKRPPEEIVDSWFDKSQDCQRLQEFVIDNKVLRSAQGIAIIDAATVIADQPEGGTDLQGKFLHEARK